MPDPGSRPGPLRKEMEGIRHDDRALHRIAPPHCRRSEAGIGLIETTIATTLLVSMALVMLSVMTSVARLQHVNRQKVIAEEAVSNLVERLRGEEFSELWVRYNDNPHDDPAADTTSGGDPTLDPTLDPTFDPMMSSSSTDGTSSTDGMGSDSGTSDPSGGTTVGSPTAPGSTFVVEGLSSVDGPVVGRIEFPEHEDETGQRRLYEGYSDEGLGMPYGRDLDGDGTIAGFIGARDYRILPVRIIIEWQSHTGPMSVSASTLITEK